MAPMGLGSIVCLLGTVLFAIGNWVENWEEGTNIAMGVIAAIGFVMISAGAGYSINKGKMNAVQKGGLIENFILDTVTSTAISEFINT